MQSAKFALMYDREALYLCGVVRDPSPLMNRQDPQVNGGRGWDADSCQFRLTVDPSQGYPVLDSSFEHLGNNPKPDTRDDIKHLTLWYFTDRDEPCLNIQMGMTLPHAAAGMGAVRRRAGRSVPGEVCESRGRARLHV